MASIHGALGCGVIVDLDEPESSSLARETVAHDGYRIGRDTIIGKEILYVRLICRVR